MFSVNLPEVAAVYISDVTCKMAPLG